MFWKLPLEILWGSTDRDLRVVFETKPSFTACNYSRYHKVKICSQCHFASNNAATSSGKSSVGRTRSTYHIAFKQLLCINQVVPSPDLILLGFFFENCNAFRATLIRIAWPALYNGFRLSPNSPEANSIRQRLRRYECGLRVKELKIIIWNYSAAQVSQMVCGLQLVVTVTGTPTPFLLVRIQHCCLVNWLTHKCTDLQD